MTTIRCSLCGEAESEQTGIVLEAGGVAEQERQFRQYWEGCPTQEDRDRQDLIHAGRGHLVR